MLLIAISQIEKPVPAKFRIADRIDFAIGFWEPACYPAGVVGDKIINAFNDSALVVTDKPIDANEYFAGGMFRWALGLTQGNTMLVEINDEAVFLGTVAHEAGHVCLNAVGVLAQDQHQKFADNNYPY